MSAEQMRVDARLDGHDKTIAEVVRTVDKLSILYENSLADRKDDRDIMKDVAGKLSHIGDRMTALIGIEKDISANKEEVRVARHDIENLKQAQMALPLLKDGLTKLEKETQEKITALKADLKICSNDVTTMKNDKIKSDGAKEAIGKAGVIFWSIFGGVFTLGFVAVFLLIMRMYFGIGIATESISGF